jgi:hypothetical protein
MESRLCDRIRLLYQRYICIRYQYIVVVVTVDSVKGCDTVVARCIAYIYCILIEWTVVVVTADSGRIYNMM